MALIGTTGGETWPPVNPPKKEAAVKVYNVEINGHQTTVKLSDQDAKKRGLTANDEAAPKAKAPANKSRTPQNKSSNEGDA